MKGRAKQRRMAARFNARPMTRMARAFRGFGAAVAVAASAFFALSAVSEAVKRAEEMERAWARAEVTSAATWRVAELEQAALEGGR